MSKKKMVAAEFNTVSVNADGKPVESPVAASASATEAEKIIDASLNMSEKVKAKLEEFDKLEKAVSVLSKENEALKSKLAEYLEELTALRDSKPEVKEIVKEVPVEKVVEKIVEVGGSGDSAKLVAEMKALREENDSYLMKISELTFENARLTASAAELAKKAEAPRPQTQPPQPYANVYRNMAAANGYSSWN